MTVVIEPVENNAGAWYLRALLAEPGAAGPRRRGAAAEASVRRFAGSALGIDVKP
jgi:hypothetical protein